MWPAKNCLDTRICTQPSPSCTGTLGKTDVQTLYEGYLSLSEYQPVKYPCRFE